VNDVSQAIKADLSAARRIVLGMDCWSKKGLSDSFLGISASFFNPVTNQPHHVLLNLHRIPHPHTGLMLADKITSSLTQWELDESKLLMAVTDNGSNMIKAINSIQLSRQVNPSVGANGADADEAELTDEGADYADDTDDSELNEGYDDICDDDDYSDQAETDDGDLSMEEAVSLHRLPCVAHTLQLVLKEIDKNAAYCNLITKTRKLVQHMRKSSVATTSLIQKSGKTVVVDCSTRWNSIYMMLARLLEIKPALLEVMEEMKLDGLLSSEWARLAELCKLLQPFREQTDIMQTDTLSLSALIPSLLELSLHLQDASFTKALSLPLLNALRRRFAVFLDPISDQFDPIPAAATFLDPTVSTTTLQRDDMMHVLQAAKTYIRKEARTVTVYTG